MKFLQTKLWILIKYLSFSAIIIIASLHFIKRQDEYFSKIRAERVKDRIDSFIERCGKNYYISWLVLDANRSKKQYYFSDVVGCNPQSTKLSCAFSVKDLKLNPFYNQEYHKFDKETFKYLDKMESGVAAYYDQPELALSGYPAIKNILDSTNKKINSVGISITKDIFGNPIYVFTMTNVGYSDKCSKYVIVDILEELSIYAKEEF